MAEKQVTLEKFKLACLQYKPNDIEIKQNDGSKDKFTRHQVISDRAKIIEQMRESIDLRFHKLNTDISQKLETKISMSESEIETFSKVKGPIQVDLSAGEQTLKHLNTRQQYKNKMINTKDMTSLILNGRIQSESRETRNIHRKTPIKTLNQYLEDNNIKEICETQR